VGEGQRLTKKGGRNPRIAFWLIKGQPFFTSGFGTLRKGEAHGPILEGKQGEQIVDLQQNRIQRTETGKMGWCFQSKMFLKKRTGGTHNVASQGGRRIVTKQQGETTSKKLVG